MTRITCALLAAALMAVVAGCGKKASDSATEQAVESSLAASGQDAEVSVDSGNMQIKSKDGEVSLGEGTKLPEGWPDDVPLYAGTKLLTAVKSGDGSTIQGTTTDALDKVTAFYKDKLTKGGWVEESVTTAPQMSMMSYSKDASSLMVMLSASDAETSISISVGKK